MLSPKAKSGRGWILAFCIFQLVFMILLTIGILTTDGMTEESLYLFIFMLVLAGISFLFWRGYRWAAYVLYAFFGLLLLIGGINTISGPFESESDKTGTYVILGYLTFSLLLSLPIPAIHTYLSEMAARRKGITGYEEKIDQIGQSDQSES